MSQPRTNPRQPHDNEPPPSDPNLPVEEPAGGLVDPRKLIPGPGEPPVLRPGLPIGSDPEEGTPDEHQPGN